MQVLQCGVPGEIVEGRVSRSLLWHAAQGHLPAVEAMAQGCQGQGDGGVGGAEEQDDGVPAGGHFGGARGQGDGSTSGWRGRGLGVMRESLAATSTLAVLMCQP